MKKTLTILLLALCVLPVFSEAQIEVSSSNEDRIVSLAPNVTEILCELGCQSNIVGRTDYCNYPESINDVQSIGTLYDPNLETIVSLQPTLVIASSIVSPDFIETLAKTGIEVHQILKEESLEGTYDLIQEIGVLTNKKQEAENIISNMKQRVSLVSEKVKSLDESQKKSVMYIIGYGEWGDYAATGDTYLNDVIEAAGGINAAKDGKFWSISKELLIKQDPSVILLSAYSYSNPEEDIKAFSSSSPYSQLTAAKEGQVYAIDGDAAERQGVRTVDTIEAIAKLLYPQLF